MENKKNEELQSRREFFKKAAKAALPVVGAVVLGSLPIVDVEAQSCKDCNNSCVWRCYQGCRADCKGLCTNSCDASCQHHCTAMQAGY